MIVGMRRVWAVLVCLCLLWSGGVAPVLASVPCDMAMAGGTGDDGAPAGMDCCQNADASTASGTGCPPGGACAVAAIALPSAGAPWSPAASTPGAPWPDSEADAPTARPGAVWRPPTGRG